MAAPGQATQRASPSSSSILMHLSTTHHHHPPATSVLYRAAHTGEVVARRPLPQHKISRGNLAQVNIKCSLYGQPPQSSAAAEPGHHHLLRVCTSAPVNNHYRPIINHPSVRNFTFSHQCPEWHRTRPAPRVPPRCHSRPAQGLVLSACGISAPEKIPGPHQYHIPAAGGRIMMPIKS